MPAPRQNFSFPQHQNRSQRSSRSPLRSAQHFEGSKPAQRQIESNLFRSLRGLSDFVFSSSLHQPNRRDAFLKDGGLCRSRTTLDHNRQGGTRLLLERNQSGIERRPKGFDSNSTRRLQLASTLHTISASIHSSSSLPANLPERLSRTYFALWNYCRTFSPIRSP